MNKQDLLGKEVLWRYKPDNAHWGEAVGIGTLLAIAQNLNREYLFVSCSHDPTKADTDNGLFISDLLAYLQGRDTTSAVHLSSLTPGIRAHVANEVVSLEAVRQSQTKTKSTTLDEELLRKILNIPKPI